MDRSIHLSAEYAPPLNALLALVDALPVHLGPKDSRAFEDLTLAASAIRFRLAYWQSGADPVSTWHGAG